MSIRFREMLTLLPVLIMLPWNGGKGEGNGRQEELGDMRDALPAWDWS